MRDPGEQELPQPGGDGRRPRGVRLDRQEPEVGRERAGALSPALEDLSEGPPGSGVLRVDPQGRLEFRDGTVDVLLPLQVDAQVEVQQRIVRESLQPAPESLFALLQLAHAVVGGADHESALGGVGGARRL